jgi:hypothetical protein
MPCAISTVELDRMASDSWTRNKMGCQLKTLAISFPPLRLSRTAVGSHGGHDGELRGRRRLGPSRRCTPAATAASGSAEGLPACAQENAPARNINSAAAVTGTWSAAAARRPWCAAGLSGYLIRSGGATALMRGGAQRLPDRQRRRLAAARQRALMSAAAAPPRQARARRRAETRRAGVTASPLMPAQVLFRLLMPLVLDFGEKSGEII